MNHAIKAIAHETKIRRWQTFTPPQNAAHAAHCGLVLHRRAYAILFDPDPLRGGKFVLQAKRYTKPVDVAAVRDLYGTVMNEGANRGILITTSSYGPDAYEFAKNKPLSLVDGPNLLRMLQRHGKSFRINLEEARRLYRENES